MKVLTQARFIAGHGIEGDRYAAGKGSFSEAHGRKGVKDHLTIYSLSDVLKINALMGRDVSTILRRNLIIEDFPMRAFLEAKLAKITTQDGGFVILKWSSDCSPCTRPGKTGGVDADKLQQAMYDYGFGGERVAIVRAVGSRIVRPGDKVEIIEDNLPNFSRRR